MSRYRVHRLDKPDQAKLEIFLNQLKGEVVAIIPNVTTLFLCYGSKVDHLLIVEKA